MGGLARDVLIATLVFLAITSLWAGTLGFAQIASALVFAMAYGAIKVAFVIFGKGSE